MFGKLARRLSLRGADVTDSNRATCGPLLITVGPQFCGKTTFVHALGEKVLEVSTEDIQGCYETVSVETILKLWNQKDSVDPFRNKTVYGILLSDRVKALVTSELALLTLLFSKQINFTDFKKHLAITLEEYEVNLVVENLMELLASSSTHKFTTKTIDIPIPEAEESVRAQAVVEMKRLIKTEPGLICWSDSNLLPSNYKDILAMAAKYQRTVRFIRWGQELPCVSLSELIKRNIIKFLSTGRYVEIKKILQSYKHADIIKSIGHKNMTQVHFARNAGFHMDEMGRVFALDPSQTTAAQGKAQKYTGSPRPLPALPPGYQPLPVQSTNWSKWTNEGVLSALGTSPLVESDSTVGLKTDSYEHEKKQDDAEAQMQVTPLKSISSSASTPDNFKPDSNKVINTPQLANVSIATAAVKDTKETKEDEKTSQLSEQSPTEQPHTVALTPEQIEVEKREKAERIALAAEWTKALEAAREAALKARSELAEKMKQGQSASVQIKSVQEIKSEPDPAENVGVSITNGSTISNTNSSPGAPTNTTTEHKRKSSKSSLPPLSPSVSRRNSRNFQDHTEFKFVDCDKLNSAGAESRVLSGDFSDGVIGIAAGVGCGGDDKTAQISDVNQEKRNSKRLSNPHSHPHSQHNPQQHQHHHHLHTEMTEVVDDNVQLTESQKHAIDSYQAAHFPLQDSNNISRFNFSNASSSNNNSSSNSTNNSTNNSNYNMSVVSYNDNDSIENSNITNKLHNNTYNVDNLNNTKLDEDNDENASDASSVSTDEAVERAELFLAKQKSQLHTILSDADHNTLRTTSLSRHNSISSQFNVTSEHNSRPNSGHNSYNNSRIHSRKNSMTDQINNNANNNVSGDVSSGGNSSNQRPSLFKSSFSRAEFSQNPVENDESFWATITALSNNQNNHDIENQSNIGSDHDDGKRSMLHSSDSSDSETEIDNVHKISAYKIEQPETIDNSVDSVVLLPTLSREKSLELIDDIAFFEAEEQQEYTKLIHETDKNIVDQPVVTEVKSKNKNTTHLTIDTAHTDTDDNNNDNNTDEMDDENETFSTKMSTLFSKKSPHSASAVAAVARANELYLKSLQENDEISNNNDAKHNIIHNESKHETALPTSKSDSVRDINHAPHSAHSVHTTASHTATSPHDEHVHFQSEIVEHGPYHLRSTHNLDPITGTVLHTHTVEEERELAASREKARVLPIVHLKSPSSSRNNSGKFNKSSISINGSNSGDNSRCTTPTTTSNITEGKQSDNIEANNTTTIATERKHLIPTPIVTTFSTSEDSTDGNSACYNADFDTTRNADIRKDHRGDFNNENSDYPKMTPNTRVHIKAKEWIENDKVVQYALENYSRDSQAIIAAEIKQMDASRHDHHTLLPLKDTVPGKSHFVDENEYFDEETASLIAKSREQDENKKVEKFAHDNYPASAEAIVAAEIKQMDTERHDHKLHSNADQNKKLHNVSENDYFDEETASLIAKSRQQIEKQKVEKFAHENYSDDAQAVIAAEIKQMDNDRHDHKLHNADKETKSLQNITENEYFDEETVSLIAKSRVSAVEQSENKKVEQFAHEHYSENAQAIIDAEIKQMDIQRHDHKLHPSKYNANNLRNVPENEYFDEETASLIAKSRFSAVEDSENKKVEQFAHDNYPASAEAIIAAEIKQMDTERHDHKLHNNPDQNKNLHNVPENEYFDEETASLIAKSRISFEEGHKRAGVNHNVKSNDVVLDSGSDDDDLLQHSTSQHVMKRNAGTSKPESASTSSSTTQNKSISKKNAKVTFTREQTPAQDGNNPFCFVNELFCGMF